ncbi:hypothetical protein DEJ33_06595 [Curtobacterium sp. MCPF17_047]|uniref:DUF6766 family protein n=1 Tax=unclassified Curtobacterium TaxID=257496 RepID=UPI000DAAB461|nr:MULTISPECIES: DUF6766 family protein [unclassified Curtobacterium]PZE61465.1 hypothetical protein DEJ24_04130 [Curtobacterium sp. MCPF17_001]PZF66933.1 hypothetical protein DEJ33_06595 [Curtobacterium sp. MCPF17_047]
MSAVRKAVRQNALGLFFGGILVAALVGQSFAGWAVFNDTQTAEGLDPIGWLEYVSSSSFTADVAENWQSEYLQFLLYIWTTVWFVQRGSPESKEQDQTGLESDADQEVGPHAGPRSPRWAAVGGLRQALFSHSLLLVMGGVFLASWAAQSAAGVVAYDEQQLLDLEAPVTWAQYVVSADFWNRTLQNWQSEFLAVGSMAVLSVFLRERGSPESKPVGAAHDDTGAEG